MTIEIVRRSGESDLAFQRRIVYGKLVDKTLSDYDYSELAEAIYGQTYSSDFARRLMYGSLKTLEAMDREEYSPETQTPDIDAKILELKKERQKFSDQRREYNKLVNEDARKEHLLERLVTAADNLSESVGVMFTQESRCHHGTSGNEAVLVLSDWHYGLETENVFNTFNTNVCRERVSKVIQSAADRICMHQCSRVHVVVLGDLFHGAIHNSARVASEELVCDQLMQVSEILAQCVEYLAPCVSEVIVYTTYGNHARTVQNKHDSVHRDNMERLVPWWLKYRLAGYGNIIVAPEEATEFVFVNSCGHEICATHGDNDTVRSSPQLLSTLFQKRYGKNVEYILLGDKHHRESFEELGVTAMICGSLCGTDDYANGKRLYSEPSQMLLIVNEECGVDAEYRLRCR